MDNQKFVLGEGPDLTASVEPTKQLGRGMPTVLRVLPGDDFTVYAYCNDGVVRLVDVKPLIARGGVFAQIKDLTCFRERLTVLNGTVAWDIMGNRDTAQCIDLDPHWIFKTAAVIRDP